MQKKVFSLMMGLILAFTGLANAQTVVEVGTGTTTASSGAFNSIWGYSFVETLYPASEIGMAGTITHLAYHINSTASYHNEVVIYMKNVSRTTFGSVSDVETVTPADIVYQGAFDFPSTSGWFGIDLDTPFQYDGTSTLMIAFDENAAGYSSRDFYYTNVSNCRVSFYSDSTNPDPYNLGSFTGSSSTGYYRSNIQLTIQSGGPMPVVLTVTPNPVDFGARPNNCWMRPMVANVLNEGPATTVYGVDVDNAYFVPSFADEELAIPFALPRGEEFDINFGWTSAPEGQVEGQLVIDCQSGRTALLYDLTAYAYEPVEPDVWEMARVINASYPFEYRDTPTTATLYDNYLLPGNAQDGPDAVYKVTFNQDVMLNGNVTPVGGTETAENGKMAVYTEDFYEDVYGFGGPDIENNYTGPQIGGGSQPYDVIIGTGTGTSGYQPCYHFYNYSLSQQVYLASMLQEAGMGAGVINTIGYYTESTYGYHMNGIKIWMANVTDATAPSTSVLTSTMTLVYEGSFDQIVGWNDFELNGNFAWDGTSNLLVFFQRNNGTYSSSIQWQYTNQSYTAGAYCYNDGSAYAPESTTYSMTTTTNLPNTHFVGGGRNRSGREIVEIGNNTGTAGSLPSAAFYRYTLTQQIYTADEIGTAGTINSISFYNASSVTPTRNLDVYLVSTTKSQFTGNYDWINVTTADKVFSGNVTMTAGSWNTITLDTPFEYDGASNLAIIVDDNTGSYVSGVTYNTFETSLCQTLFIYSDGTNYDALSPSSYYGNQSSLKNQIQLDIDEVSPTPEGDNLINNMTMVPGTYYIAASSTADAWDVVLNAEALPCPEMAYNPSPADDADDLEPAAVNLSWRLGQYTTEYRLRFGSTYYCEDVLVDWTTDLAQTYTVRNLYNNTNYFWRVDERNGNCETLGEVWGFTTHLNVPQNLRVADETIFEGQSAVLSWNAIQDRTYRYYNIYQDGDLIASTPANVVTTTYTVNGLTYNMDGYTFYVTAVYDEGESAPSNTVNVKVSGNALVAGTVYEQDGETGIANATVTFIGHDEFGDSQTFNFTTGTNGTYRGTIMAGQYDGMAACEGYQTITEPTCGNPVNFTYAQTTAPVDFILDENFNPVCQVIAQYYPDSLDPASPYVKVYWGCGLPGSAIIEDFETGDFSQFDYNFPGSYPWEIVTTHPYEGQYCMKSGGTNINSASSSVEVTVDIPRDGLFSFYSYISCESSWDNGYYYMDGAQMGTVTGLGNNWVKKEFAVTEGTHTFKWTYTKDSSVNSGEDAWFVDYIDFVHDAEPAQPGWHTYTEGEFDNALGSNLTTTPTWGYLYPNGGGFAGMRLTKVALFSDNQYSAVGGNYTLNVILGGATPDNGTVASTMTVDVPSNQNAWVEWDLTTPVTITGNENVWVLWTANTTVSSWPAGMAPGSDANGSWWNGGNGWEQMLSTYGDVWTMKNYFAGRNGRIYEDSRLASNQVVAPTPSFTTVKPEKGETLEAANVCNPSAIHAANVPGQADRAFSHYRVYRTSCYNDGPYTEENTVVLACELQDTIYIDVEWGDLPAGVYKWGVGVVYNGNRESEITWATVNNEAHPAVPVTDGSIDVTGRRPGQAPAYNGNGMSEAFRGSTAYVDNTYGYVIPSGLCVMDIDNPQGASSLNASSSLYAGEIVDGVIYGYTSDGYFVTFDPETGAQLSSVYAGTGIREMAYDHSTNTMYGSSTSDNNLYRIDMTNGSYTVVGTMSNVTAVAGLVCDLTGQLYAMAFTTGDLYKVDKTNAAMTLVGNTGRTPAYVQSAAIDYATGTCYWAYSDASYDDLYTVDLATAQANFVCSFVESCGLCFPYSGGPLPPGPDPQHDPIQEERESPIVWSNCLDKDMYLDGDVTINVLLNSADNPEGTTVTFTNLNEIEQELYPMDPIVLDETGFYAFDSFRKGDYSILIQHEGYFDIAVEESIWEATDLRYVMTEIIYGVDGLYVSSTGWAMWEGQGPGPVPPHGGDEFEFGFDSGLDGWTNIDADGDGEVWYPSSQAGNHSVLAITSHSGVGHLMSESYCNAGGALYPNNFLVSPQMYNIGGSSVLSFWCCAQDASYAAEHFGVAISTTGNTNAADFTTIQEWTLTAKGGNEVPAAATRNGKSNREGNWYQFTCDLSAYAGQQAWIAIRHFNVSDQFIICLDDMALTNGAKSDERHLEYYKVMCTSIDGEAIFNTDTEHPFCQVATDELVQGEHYICKVAAVYSTGMSDWAECEWAYIPCDNYAGTTEGVIEEEPAGGNHFSWTYPTGPGPVPPGPGDEWSYSFDNGFDGWTTIDADGDGHNWYHSSEAGNHGTAAVTSHSGAGHLMSESYCNATYAALTPDEYVVSPASAIANGSTFSFWVCAQDASYAAEHYGVAVSTDGTNFTTIEEWTLTAKGGIEVNPAATRNGKNNREGNWYQKSVSLSDYAGQTLYIAVRHFNCTDQFILLLDDAELTIGAKSSRDIVAFNGFVTDPGAMANGADASWIKGSQGTWGPNVNNGGGYMLGDSFTLNAATTIEEIEVYGYQTGSTTTSTFTGLYAQIYNGNPMNGGTAIWGDMSTNLMTSTAFTNCYRGSDGETTATTRPIMSITASGLNISLDAGTYYLVYSLAGTGSSGPWGAPHAEPNIGNTGAGVQYTTSWVALTDSGSGTTYGCAMKISGNGGTPGPVPGDNEVIGAMIFRDGEWLAQVDYPTSEYIDTDEYGHHVYCVRLIYAGTNFLPEGNIYYSMSCEECIEIGDGEHCPAGADIRGEYVWNEGGEFGALISWGEQVPPITPVEEWLYYDNGTYASSVGTGSPSPCYWGVMFPATAMGAYDGCSLTQVALFDAYAATYTCNIYYGGNNPNGGTLVHSQDLTGTGSLDWVYANLTSALPIDATQNLWITFYCNTLEYPMAGSNDTGDANGRWVSLDGSTWEDISGYGLNYTWMIRGFVTNQAKGGSIVALDPFQGGASEGNLKAIAGSSNVEFDFGNRAAQIVKYNVYRSADNNDYDLIGSVNAVAGQDYYEYFDEIAAGAYYYQVTAVYDNDCESDPALAEGNHANNYVIVAVTGVEENEGIALYPNPTSGNVKIEAVGMNHITVVSALGQVVYDVEVSCDEYELNMAQFNAGIYMVRISSESGVSTQRVTVVR